MRSYTRTTGSKMWSSSNKVKLASEGIRCAYTRAIGWQCHKHPTHFYHGPLRVATNHPWTTLSVRQINKLSRFIYCTETISGFRCCMINAHSISKLEIFPFFPFNDIKAKQKLVTLCHRIRRKNVMGISMVILFLIVFSLWRDEFSASKQYG